MTIEQALAHIVALETELAGEKKANVLLNAGMGSVCDGRDELKHENRALKAQIAEAVAAERERCATRIAELEAALRPFAAVTEWPDVVGGVNGPLPDRYALVWDVVTEEEAEAMKGSPVPTLGDCRRAAAVLAKGGER